jgi:WD40 repeat protein
MQHDDVQHEPWRHQAGRHAASGFVRRLLSRWGHFGGRKAIAKAHPTSVCSVVFEEQEDPEARSFFSEIIASISDIKFSPDGRYIIARDFLTLKVWDINMNTRPVQTINVSERSTVNGRFATSNTSCLHG